MLNWHKADLDNRMYVNIEGAKKISMPRYYKDKVYTEVERLCISNTYQQKMEKIKQEEFKNYDSKKEYAKALAIQQAFKRMHLKAEQNRNKI